MGFTSSAPPCELPKLDQKVEKLASTAAKRRFAPEFMNRIDKVAVFRPLRSSQLERVLEIELAMVQQRVLDTAKQHFLFRVGPAAKSFLLREGTDLKYGARHLKRAIERHVVYPLASLLATGQLCADDAVSIDWDETSQMLTFMREAKVTASPEDSQRPSELAARFDNVDGRELSKGSAAGSAADPAADRNYQSETA